MISTGYIADLFARSLPVTPDADRSVWASTLQ
jgi:hypothetical protein